MDQNLETKNEYFSRKEEKEKALKEEARKKMVRRAIWRVVVLIVLVLLGLWIYNFFSKEATKGPVPGQYFQAQSRDHIKRGDSHPAYNSNPPTGGWHYGDPAQTGIYDVELPDEQVIHNLEHSHIWIAYRPDLSPDEVEKLASIAKNYGSKIIMTKRATNDAKIAIVAWEHLLKLDGVDEEPIRTFVDAYRGLAGPEKIPDFGFKDFRLKK